MFISSFIRPFLKELLILTLCSISIKALSADNREQVLIIDTGIPKDTSAFEKYLCEEPSVDLTGRGLTDVDGHGTNIIGLIYPYMDPNRQCIVMVKYYHNKAEWGYKYDKDDGYPHKIFNQVGDNITRLNPKFINMSYTGNGFFQKEYEALRSVLDRGTFVSVAAGNSSHNLSADCNAYPACYPLTYARFFVVSTNAGFANYGGPVNIVRDGVHQCGLGICLSGTSQATAINTGLTIYKHNKEILNGKKRAKHLPKRTKSRCKGTEGSCRRSDS